MVNIKIKFWTPKIVGEGDIISNKNLETYRKKRHFSVTPEPLGKKEKKKSSTLRFVIQKHAASHLHYDFRLEMEGVLKSWAVPKGPSLNPSDKRLALQVEDHPLEYQEFEGLIPKGQYGEGSVIIWDKGTYSNMIPGIPLIEGYKKGHLIIKLKGIKLKGGFVLQRIKEGSSPQWLLIKLKDKDTNPTYNIIADDKSVVSGKTIQEIESENTYG